MPQTYNKLTLRESNNPDKIVEALYSVRLACNLRSTILPDRSGRTADFGSLSKKVLQLNKSQSYKNAWYEELFALYIEENIFTNDFVLEMIN